MLSLHTSNPDTLAFTLEEALARFFSTYMNGVITVAEYSMSISKVGHEYWFFDSHKRGNTGLPDGLNGKAVIIYFLNLQLFANHIRNVFSVSDAPFYLTSVDISKLSSYTLSELGECEIRKESPNFELQKKK